MAVNGSGKGGAITLPDVRAALERGQRERVILRDGTEGGLFLRAGARGAVWTLEYRRPGQDAKGRRHPNRYLRLGTVAALSPEEARRAASRAKQAAMDGDDPQEARQVRQARAAAPGWQDVQADYMRHLARHLPNDRSRQNERRYLAHLFDPIGDATARLDPKAPLQAIDLPAVHRLGDTLPATGTVARQVLGALGRLHDWARGRALVDTANPVRLLPRGARPKKAPPRMRALTLAELGTLWRGADKLALSLERRMLRLLIALPLRKGEASALQWEWLDRDAATVKLPAKIMKNGEAHTLPLGTMARELLDEIAGGEDWPKAGRVFVTNNARLLEWSRFKKRADRAAPLSAHWTFHDFRRSFVSALAERGHAEAVLDMMLAHKASSTRSGVLAVYQTAQRLPEQRRAMMAWDGLLRRAIDGGQVVRLKSPH